MPRGRLTVTSRSCPVSPGERRRLAEKPLIGSIRIALMEASFPQSMRRTQAARRRRWPTRQEGIKDERMLGAEEQERNAPCCGRTQPRASRESRFRHAHRWFHTNAYAHSSTQHACPICRAAIEQWAGRKLSNEESLSSSSSSLHDGTATGPHGGNSRSHEQVINREVLLVPVRVSRHGSWSATSRPPKSSEREERSEEASQYYP